jgi:hypothetical protein
MEQSYPDIKPWIVKIFEAQIVEERVQKFIFQF